MINLVVFSGRYNGLQRNIAAEAFEAAVGEQDNAMRLSLNYQSEICSAW